MFGKRFLRSSLKNLVGSSKQWQAREERIKEHRGEKHQALGSEGRPTRRPMISSACRHRIGIASISASRRSQSSPMAGRCSEIRQTHSSECQR